MAQYGVFLTHARAHLQVGPGSAPGAPPPHKNWEQSVGPKCIPRLTTDVLDACKSTYGRWALAARRGPTGTGNSLWAQCIFPSSTWMFLTPANPHVAGGARQRAGGAAARQEPGALRGRQAHRGGAQRSPAVPLPELQGCARCLLQPRRTPKMLFCTLSSPAETQSCTFCLAQPGRNPRVRLLPCPARQNSKGAFAALSGPAKLQGCACCLAQPLAWQVPTGRTHLMGPGFRGR